MAKPSTVQSGRQARRLVELDSLRGIAALAVLVFHYTVMYPAYFGDQHTPFFQFRLGKMGPYLFFIISGFVILMTVSRAKSALDFGVSRFSRIYPVYWAAVILSFTAMSLTNTWPVSRISPQTAVINLTMFERFVHVQEVDVVYWTLQYELVFYALALGVLIFGLVRWTDWLCLAVLLLSVAHQFALDHQFYAHLALAGTAIKWAVLLVLIFQKVQFFALGMTLYLCWRDGFNRLRGINVGLALMVVAYVNGASFAIVAAISALAIALAVTDHLPQLRARPLVFLGTISYSLYLTHQTLGFVMIRGLEGLGLNVNIALALAALGAIAIATVLTRTVEQPAMRWIRSRYRESSPRPLAASAKPVAMAAD